MFRPVTCGDRRSDPAIDTGTGTGIATGIPAGKGIKGGGNDVYGGGSHDTPPTLDVVCTDEGIRGPEALSTLEGPGPEWGTHSTGEDATFLGTRCGTSSSTWSGGVKNNDRDWY